MKKIYYLFRRPVVSDIEKAYKGQYPEDFFYGFTRLNRYWKLRVSDRGESNKLIQIFHQVLNKTVFRYSKISISLASVLIQYFQIKKSDIIFATVDSYGLAVALLKSWGLFKKQKLIINTFILCDALVDYKNSYFFKVCRYLSRFVDLFIAVGTFAECQKMSSLLSLPIKRFKFIPFGTDTQYFLPQYNLESDFVLIIGADRKRDWELYKKLFLNFPQHKFVIITHPNVIKLPVLKNVIVYFNLPIAQVKSYIAKAKFLVIISKQNYYFAGQSTAFRAMSMGKPVIITESYGTKEYNLKQGRECIMIKPGSYPELKKAYLQLQDIKVRRKIGINARRKIIRDLSFTRYTERLRAVFNNL